MAKATGKSDFEAFSINMRGYLPDMSNPQITVRGSTIDEFRKNWQDAQVFLAEIGFSPLHPQAVKEKAAQETTVEYHSYVVGSQDDKDMVWLYTDRPGFSKYPLTIWPERMRDLPLELTGKEKTSPVRLQHEDAKKKHLLTPLPEPITIVIPFALDDDGNVKTQMSSDGTKEYPVRDERNWHLVGQHRVTKDEVDAVDLSGAYAKAVAALPKDDPTALNMVKYVRAAEENTDDAGRMSADDLDDLCERISDFIGEGGAGEAIIAVLAGREITDVMDTPPPTLAFSTITQLLDGDLQEAHTDRISKALHTIYSAYTAYPTF